MPKEIRKADLENLKILTEREKMPGVLPLSFEIVKKYLLDIFKEAGMKGKAYKTKDNEVFYITITDSKITLKQGDKQ